MTDATYHRRRFPEFLTADQAAEYLGIGRTTLYELHAMGRIPAPVSLSDSLTRWAKSDLRRWVDWGAPWRADFESMRVTQARRAGFSL